MIMTEIVGIDGKDLAYLVGALGGMLGLKHIITDQYNRFVKRRDAIDTNTTWHDHFIKMDQVYGCLQRLQHDTGAQRVLIVQNQNGGGKPHLDSTIYSTVIHEVFGTDVLQSMKDDWHMQVLDRAYLAMLSEMDKSGEMVVTLDGMDKEGILAKMYFSKGIVGSRIYRLSDKYDKYTYLVANYVDSVDVGGPADDVYRSVVNELRLLFNGG